MNILNTRGSLIVNLLVSLGIIILVTSLSIPAFRQYNESLAINDAAQALVVDLRYAQQLAITEQVTHGVIINDTSDFYMVARYDGATTTLKTVVLPTDVTFLSVSGFASDFIKYSSYGSVIESGIVELVHTSGKIKTINVRPSGYVQLQ